MDWSRFTREFETQLRLERNLSDNSVQAYLHDVALLRSFAEPLGIEPQDVTEENLHSLFKQLNETGIAVTTQCRIISGLRAFFRMLVMDNVLPDNPAEHLAMPNTSKTSA